MPILERLELPIVQAPLAGGASTPALAAAVCEAGGLGFLAAGYKTADAVRADLETLRGVTERPVGLNIFAPPGGPADPGGGVPPQTSPRPGGARPTTRPCARTRRGCATRVSSASRGTTTTAGRRS